MSKSDGKFKPGDTVYIARILSKWDRGRREERVGTFCEIDNLFGQVEEGNIYDLKGDDEFRWLEGELELFEPDLCGAEVLI